jgi:hypothetical protein
MNSLDNLKEIRHPKNLENVKEGELIVVEDENKVRKSGFYAGIFQNSKGPEIFLVGNDVCNYYNLFKFPITKNKIGKYIPSSPIYAGIDKDIYDIVNDIKTNQDMLEAEK